MTILICTTSTLRDPGVDLVVAAIAARGGRAFRFETDLFPTDASIRVRLGDRQVRRLTSPAGELDLDEVSAVWVREIGSGKHLPDELEPSHREAARVESEAMVWGLLECLDVFQLDPAVRLQAVPGKPVQLQRARALGLDVPRTLVTNEPRAVRDFAAACPAGIIAKMVHGAHVQSADGEEPIYTRLLEPEELAELEGLELAPMIFQERVPKALELRLTIVGSRVFAAAIDSQQSELGAVDWRADPALVRGFRPYDELPADVEGKLLRLLDSCGLNFATIDVIVTPDGRYVFLEFNPSRSYFGFIEQATGLPISGAVADLLLGRVPPRVRE
ncbi:MAG TPA: MvdD family ATP-grasp ribosomal peptide maturase [Thermoanaerobaculia bacterium]